MQYTKPYHFLNPLSPYFGTGPPYAGVLLTTQVITSCMSSNGRCTVDDMVHGPTCKMVSKFNHDESCVSYHFVVPPESLLLVPKPLSFIPVLTLTVSISSFLIVRSDPRRSYLSSHRLSRNVSSLPWSLGSLPWFGLRFFSVSSSLMDSVSIALPRLGLRSPLLFDSEDPEKKGDDLSRN